MATTKAYELARLLADGFVGSSEIGSDQVLSGNLADNAVTTAKIANSAVTADKINIASSDVPYDNTVSGLSANTVKEAIDALNAISGGGNAGAQATFSREKFTATAGQTSFTVTGGYDVGYLLVFMNGVLLDISDFTASDGVGFTLAVAAKAGDEIVAIKLDSFAIAELLRIFNTSASAPNDAVTVDASGSVIIGANTTTKKLYVQDTDIGATLSTYGVASFEEEDAHVDINSTNDGTWGSAINLREYDTAGNYLNAWSMARHSTTSGTGRLNFNYGTQNDHNINNVQAYLTTDGKLWTGGGMYIGGQGASNLLDDYEEGTWTPTSGSSALGNLSIQKAQYTKIGRQVHLFAQFTSDSTTTVTLDNSVIISGLPFAVDSGSPKGIGGILQFYASHGQSKNALADMLISNGNLDCEIIVVRGSFAYASCLTICVNVTYNTTA